MDKLIQSDKVNFLTGYMDVACFVGIGEVRH